MTPMLRHLVLLVGAGRGRVMKKAALALLVILVPIALMSVQRARVQVQRLELRVADSVLRAGTAIRVDARSSGRAPVEILLELVQSGRSETLAARFIPKNNFALDPRRRSESMSAEITPEIRAKLHSGPAKVRVSGLGRRVLGWTPPPAVREVDVTVLNTGPGAPAASINSDEAKRIVESRARHVLEAIEARDMERFASFVHPEKGVRFSPYTNVHPESDVVIKRDQMAPLWRSQDKRRWGSFDGSGHPIEMTFAEYHRRFIYDHDYARSPHVGYNSVPLGTGNTPNTVAKTYPGAVTVEHHFPGYDPKYEGMDWTSLWLVFERQGTEWYLVGVAHGSWTI